MRTLRLFGLAVAALVVLGCASSCVVNPQPETETASLPPIPDHVDSQLGPVRVFVVATIPYPEDTTVTVLGEFLSQPRVILLRAGMARVALWQVLLHERCHLELYDAGVAMGSALEDRVCDVWGTADVRVFGAGVVAVARRRSQAP